MGFLRSLFGPSQAEIWSELAREIGGRFEAGGLFETSRVEAQHGDWIVTLDTYAVSTGKSSTTYTRLRAPYINRDGFQFTLYRAGLFTPLGMMFGMQDIEIGDPVFDKAFVIKSNREEMVRALLQDEMIRQQIAGLSDVYLDIKDDEGWFSRRFPEGVDEIYFQRMGVSKDLAELRTLFDLFARLLDRLCTLGSAYEGDPFAQHENLMLLRGSAAPPPPTDLLRPSRQVSPTDPKELLRPDNAEKTEG